MIIIEGSDGVGKTTLAKSLQIALNSAYVHYGPLPDWWMPWDYLLRHVRHAVYDRYHWSALAYSLVKEQPWDATVDKCREIDEMLRHATRGRYATICLYRSDDDWYDRPEFEDHLFTAEECKTVNFWYRSHCQEFTCSRDISLHGWVEPEEILEVLRRTNASVLDGR